MLSLVIVKTTNYENPNLTNIIKLCFNGRCVNGETR